MIIHREFEQGSGAWLEARCGIPTASEFHKLVTPKFEIRKGEMPATYLAQKLAEKWGGPLLGFGAWATEQGQFREQQAIPWYEFEFGVTIERIGLLTTEDGRIACSPDGVISETGIEVKCPEATNHVKYLLGGKVPDDYLAQVHGGMFVSGFNSWKFLSYRNHFPPLVVTVERDEEIQKKLYEALAEFLERFDAAMERMIEINGGPPPKRVATAEMSYQQWQSHLERQADINSERMNDVPIP